MKTVSFYAYKGGTGRSLVLANAAKYLARLGRTVFTLDLDLEAPGLHYKLALLDKSTRLPVRHGLVDYVDEFVQTSALPESLAPYVVDASDAADADRQGKIWLMAAGNVLAADYWKKLARINWHGLFYEENAKGIPLFLELKERIAKEYNPDFLLIDARTGITEVGGVATTILPDQVICLLLNNYENIDGTRQVLRSMLTANRLPGQSPLQIIPVLSRVPAQRALSAGSRVVSTARNRIVEEVDRSLRADAAVAELLDHEPLLVLRSEDKLQYTESLRIGGDTSVDRSPLLRDYLQLFSKIIPRDAVKPHLSKLIASSLKGMIDSPDATQADLEALVEYCPHADSYLALLKFYRVRNASPAKLLGTAARFWELDRETAHPLLWDVVLHAFPDFRDEKTGLDAGLLVEFVEAIWTGIGELDARVGFALADFCFSTIRDSQRAVDVLQKFLRGSSPDEHLVSECLKRLTRAEAWDVASELIEKYKPNMSEDAAFQAAWANAIVKQDDPVSARSFLDSKAFKPAKLQSAHPATYARLLRLTGQTEELEATLENALNQELGRRAASPVMFEIARLYTELGKKDVFEERVRKTLPAREADRILQRMLPF